MAVSFTTQNNVGKSAGVPTVMKYTDRTRTVLAKMMDALVIDSDYSFRLADEQFSVTPSSTASDTPLIRNMQFVLYRACYCHPFGLPVPKVENPPSAEHLLQELTSIHNGLSTWDRGWSLYGAGTDGRVYLQKGERQRIALPGEFITATPGASLQTGMQVSLWMERSSAMYQPGFFHFFGDIPTDSWDDFDLFRFYFHTIPHGVSHLIRNLSRSLSRYRIPYMMKTLVQPESYIRADATVLYIARRYHQIVLRILQNLSDADRQALRPEIPLFTSMLSSGIGFADDPGRNESFGMHRCRLVAEAIYTCALEGRQDTASRMEATERIFTQNGLTLDRPHLGAGKSEIFIPEQKEKMSA